jgi:hypothetical protein
MKVNFSIDNPKWLENYVVDQEFFNNIYSDISKNNSMKELFDNDPLCLKNLFVSTAKNLGYKDIVKLENEDLVIYLEDNVELMLAAICGDNRECYERDKE